MQLCILCVGRKARDPLITATDDYLARLRRHTKVELVRIKDGDTASQTRTLLAKVVQVERLIALDERGELWTTQQLSDNLRAWQLKGVNRVAFLIGGAGGLDESLTRRADHVLSLSKMTLPHRLAQVMLAEQLYRAETIIRGAPYHR